MVSVRHCYLGFFFPVFLFFFSTFYKRDFGTFILLWLFSVSFQCRFFIAKLLCNPLFWIHLVFSSGAICFLDFFYGFSFFLNFDRNGRRWPSFRSTFCYLLLTESRQKVLYFSSFFKRLCDWWIMLQKILDTADQLMNDVKALLNHKTALWVWHLFIGFFPFGCGYWCFVVWHLEITVTFTVPFFVI